VVRPPLPPDDRPYKLRSVERGDEISDALDSRKFWGRLGHTAKVWAAWIVGVSAAVALSASYLADFMRWVAATFFGPS